MNKNLEIWTEIFYTSLDVPLKETMVYNIVNQYINALKLNDFSELKTLWKNEQDFKKELDILSRSNEPEFELLSKMLGEFEFANGLKEIDLFGLNLVTFNFNEDYSTIETLGSNSTISNDSI